MSEPLITWEPRAAECFAWRTAEALIRQRADEMRDGQRGRRSALSVEVEQYLRDLANELELRVHQMLRHEDSIEWP